MTTYLGLMAETVTFDSADGEQISGYFARPLGAGPFPNVIVVHHMPGWDDAGPNLNPDSKMAERDLTEYKVHED